MIYRLVADGARSIQTSCRAEVVKVATLDNVFGKSTDAVFGISKAGVIRYSNRSFQRLMGYSTEQLCGASCARILCGTDLHGGAFCGPDCPIPKTVAEHPAISDFDIIVKRHDGDAVMVNIGTCYVSHQLPDVNGVDVLFSLRRINPQRLLQRMSATAGTGAATNTRLHGHMRLTTREQAILNLAAEGMSTSQIAEELSVSSQTVRTHFRNIYRKLGVNSRVEAVVVAMHYKLNSAIPGYRNR